MRKWRPRQFRSTAIASRVMPASGPVRSRSSPNKRLIRVDLPLFGRRFRQSGAQCLVEPGEALAMFGADRHRIAEPERISVEHTGLGRAALAFIRDEDRRFAGFANNVGE